MPRRIMLAVLCAVLLGAAACGGKPPAPRTMAPVGPVMAADPALNWTGSWRFHGNRAVTADIDTTTDVGIGTVTIDGLPGQVVFGDEQLYLRAPAAYWTRIGEPAAAAKEHAGRWAAVTEPEGDEAVVYLAGLDPTLLTPSHLGPLLAGKGTGNCAAGQATIRRWTAAAPAPAPKGVPGGVPAGSVRFTNPPKGFCAPGTYWVSPAHQLLAYVGDGQPVTAEPKDAVMTGTALRIRTGDTARAADVYRRVTAVVSALPSTLPLSVQVNTDPTAQEQLAPAVCSDSSCSRLDMDVTGGTTSSTLTVWLAITFTLSAYQGKPVGSCRVTVSDVGPDSTKQAHCVIVDSRLAATRTETGDFEFESKYDIDVLRVTERIDPARLAARIGHAPH